MRPRLDGDVLAAFPRVARERRTGKGDVTQQGPEGSEEADTEMQGAPGVLTTLLTESRSAWLEISEETSREKRKKVQTFCKQANQESEWTGKLAEQHKGSIFRLVVVNSQQNQWVCLSFSAAYI